MKKFAIATAVMTLLAACGGGGSSATGSGTAPTSNAAPTTPGTTPAPTQTIVTAPVAPASTLHLTANGYTEGSSGQTTVVKFNNAANLTLSGQLANLWIDAAQAGGGVTISGKLNTLVFAPGLDTTVTVTDTASGNTLYLPVGSAIKVAGAGAAGTTVLYYKP